VKLNRLIKRLRREALANPKKAAVLGLLALVALYYWAPLVHGWIDNEQANDDAQAAAVDPGLDPFVLGHFGSTREVPPQVSTPPDQAASHPWEQIDQWMAKDPRTVSADDVPDWRDPFAPTLWADAGDEPELDAQQTLPAELVLTADSLNLQLTSTMVGPLGRLAMIDGKTYGEGETLEITRNQQPLELKLVQVLPRRVVLQGQGRQFELVIPERESSGRIELTRDRN
jgi:hypothetical protein